MNKFRVYISVVIIITVLFCTIYVVAQQSVRMSANNSSIAAATDAADDLNNGHEPEDVIGKAIDLGSSQSVFTIVYDKQGHVVTGSGTLDGAVPVVPLGVLTSSNKKPYNAVTWQLKDGIRVASASVQANNYYVLSGHSLRDTEQTIELIGKLTLFGLIVSYVIVAVTAYMGKYGDKSVVKL